MYKFVDLPYKYKPIKRLVPENTYTNQPIKQEQEDQFRVTQEPINETLADHVKSEPVSRVIVSKPTSVIVRCGRARALKNYVPTYESTTST